MSFTANMPTRRVRPSGDAKWAKTRGVRGLLSCIVDFPQDILYEIFCYLHPRDILQLSRTTRDLRAFLMTSSAATIWKTVRLNVEVEGLPECPPDLNEAQFMDLLFFTHCYHCLAPQSMRTVLWNCRTRTCTTCFAQLYGKVDDYSQYGLLNEETLPQYVPTDTLERRKNGKTEEYTVFRYDLADSFNDWLADLQLYESLGAVTGEKAIEMLQQRELSVLEHQNHSAVCAEWMVQLEEYRQEERERLRQIRTKCIIERLARAGWADEIVAQCEFEGLDFLTSEKVFKDTKPLTDRMWYSMEPGLSELLQQQQDHRLAVQKDEAWKERFSSFTELVKAHLRSLPHDVLMPPLADILASPAFENILMNTPLQQEITAETLRNAFLMLPTIAATWIHKANADLVEMLHEAGIEDATPEKLSLAKLLFKCEHCSDMLRYPRILIHSEFCGRPRGGWGREFEFYNAEYLLHHLGLEAWNPTAHYSVDVRDMRLRKRIIEACELDPETTSAEAMEALNPIIKVRTQTSRHFYHWKTFDLMTPEKRRLHDFHSYSLLRVGSTEHQCAILHGTRKPAVPAVKQTWHKRREEVICCNHCDHRMVIQEIQSHMNQMHNRSPVSSEDWTWHIDTPSDVCVLKGFRFNSDDSDS